MIEQIKQDRVVQILLGLIGLVVCVGCLGATWVALIVAGQTDSPAAIAEPPTSTPSQAETPVSPEASPPTVTPLPEMTTPSEIELTEDTQNTYMALLFLEGSIVMLEETANQVQAGQADEFETFGQLLGIGAVLQATHEALEKPAPDPNMQPAWDAAQEATPLIQDTIKRWVDQEITAPDVVPALIPAKEKVDQALSLGDAVIAEYGIDPNELAQLREEAMADLREDFTATDLPDETTTTESQNIAETESQEPTTDDQQTAPPAEIALEILSMNDYVDSIDYLHVVGEIENQSDLPYEFVKVAVTLYDEAGSVVSTDFTYTAIDIIRPGQKVPFEVSTDQYNNAVRYEAQVSGRPTDTLPYTGLNIVSTNEYVDDIGYWHLVGEVVNDGEATAEFVKLVITLYNDIGEVVGTDFTYAELDTVPPGGKSPFDLSLSNKIDFTEYQVQVQGQPQ